MAKKRVTAYEVCPTTVKIVGLDTEDGPEHPLWQDRATLGLDEAKVMTAFTHGIDEVVTVTKDNLVVGGRQRTKALRAANELRVKAGLEPHMLKIMIKKSDDPKALVGAMVRENALRVDLTPHQKAEQAQKMVETQGFSLEEVASEFGVGVQCVKNWLSVIKMAPEVKAAVKAGKISSDKALKEFRKVRPEKQAEKLTKVLEQQKVEPRKKRNTNKQFAAWMSKDNEGSTLNKQCSLLLQWVHGEATTAECEREITGFKASLARAKRALA